MPLIAVCAIPENGFVVFHFSNNCLDVLALVAIIVIECTQSTLKIIEYDWEALLVASDEDECS